MRRFRRFRFALPRWLRHVAAALAAVFAILLLSEQILLDPLIAIAEAEAKNRGIASVNQVLFQDVGRSLSNDLVIYEKDQQGRIAAYRINTRGVSQIALEAARAVEQEYRELSSHTYWVPAGALTRSRLFGSMGPSIPIKFTPIGAVTTDLQQEFKSEGINQTRHRIWLHTEARVRVILPMVTREVTIGGDLPITETVIVGPVPSYYGERLGGATLPLAPGGQ